MELNENSVKIFGDKLYAFLNYTLPGIFTLEIFFKNGLFSKSPENLYQFILLVFWAFILSIPFNLVSAFSFKSYFYALKDASKKKNKIPENQIKEIEEKLEEYCKQNEEEFEKIDSQLHFILLFLYLSSIFFIYKYLVTRYIYTNTWSINPKILIYLNSLLIFYIIIYPFILLIVKGIEKIIISKQLKEIHES
ncbi:hypothetical protein ACMDB5_01560 [Flavobacterium sp. W1B]|uniref:hypothetical protein n=1 Tax=Flavobacterium sp. W1B TaxID=3394146 RepID=UPI0039BC4CFD